MTVPLHVRRIGAGAPMLVLLHGLGANGAVWEQFASLLTRWPGQILIPDLRGHGLSPRGDRYAESDHADDVAALLQDSSDIYIVGHSMGGMIALLLAAPSRKLRVRAVFAFGVKASWTADDIDKALAVAARPVKRFATREEAAERFLLVSGLKGLVEADAAVVQAGVAATGDGFSLSADPRTMAAVGGSLANAFSGARSISRLACGGRDPLVTIDQLRAIDPRAIALGDCGHNPHVENPELLLAAIPFLATDGEENPKR
ncbi:MAG: alpha/beta fold hydrolase [Pseudomonadota bacterium]